MLTSTNGRRKDATPSCPRGPPTALKGLITTGTSKKALLLVARFVLQEARERGDRPVAEAGPDLVVINGGENMGVREHDVFDVRAEGRTVTDPVTGNVLETMPGQVVGQVKVRVVRPASAHALLVSGSAQRGQLLERVEE